MWRLSSCAVNLLSEARKLYFLVPSTYLRRGSLIFDLYWLDRSFFFTIQTLKTLERCGGMRFFLILLARMSCLRGMRKFRKFRSPGRNHSGVSPAPGRLGPTSARRSA